MSIFQVEPCTDGAGCDPTPRLDSEVAILCDVLADTVVGYALVVYQFNNVDGSSPTTPLYLNPVTGAPYVVQGELQVCPTGGGGGGVSEVVSLSAGTLAALENISAVISGVVSVDNFPASTEISNDVGNPVPVNGTVALDGPTLAALEAITAIISGTVALDGPTLAALETTELGAATLAALENITAAVTGTVAVSNFPASTEISNDMGNPVPTSDDFIGGQILADQVGAGAVLTFTFSAPVNLVWVTETSALTTAVCRADPFGGTPTAVLGIPVFNQAPTPITVTTSVVKVFAPAGTNVSVYGYRRV